MNDSDRTYLWNRFLSRDADGTLGELVAFIEARDNAIRLALLDELAAQYRAWLPYPLRQYIAELRAKYTEPGSKP